MLMLAVLVHVYATTHSASMATVAFLVEMAPVVLVSPFAGLLADRIDRRRLVVGADLLRALILIPLACNASLPVLLSTLAVQAAIDAVFRPAFGAMLPGRVGPANTAAANGLMNTTFASLGLFAPALGAAIYASQGLRMLVIIDIVSFLLGAAMTATLGSEVREARVLGPSTSSFEAMRLDLRVGISAIARSPLLRIVILAECTLSLTEGILKPIFVPFIFGTLHGDPSRVGLAATSQAIGGVVAGLLVAALAHRMRPSRMAVIGLQGFALTVTAMALAPTYAFALLVMLLMGLPGTFSMVGLDSSVQLHADPSVMGRVFGAKATVTSMCVLVATLIPATLTSWLGVRGVIGVAAGILVLTALILVRGERTQAAAQPTLIGALD